ncbi:MAG: hypothetical protein GH142_00250 [Dehalococcoidia bacterium]|nr:hypothetical protein [Dehalococcoidia bacterium]
MKISLKITVYTVLILVLVSPFNMVPAKKIDRTGPASLAKTSSVAAARPDKAFFNHTTAKLWSAITNYGGYGDPNFDATGRPSAQWPGGSGNNYLYDGGISIGTILGGEAAVSTYQGSQFEDIEFLPSEGFPGELGSVVNGQKAQSQEDSYMVYDDFEEYPDHEPLGLRVYQRGMTWGLPEYDDFIVFKYEIVNTGLRGDLRDVFVSFWYDIDVASSAEEHHIDDLVDFDGWDGHDSDTDILDVVDPLDLDGDGDTGYDEWGIPWSRDKGHNPNYDRTRQEGDGFYDEWALILDPAGPVIKWQTDVTNANEESGFSYTAAPGELAVVGGDTLRGWLFPRSLSYIYDADNPSTSGNDYGQRELVPDNSGFYGGLFISTPAPKNVLEDGSEYMGAYAHQWWNWESDPDNDEDKHAYQKGEHTASLGKRFLPNPLELGFPQFDYRFYLTTGPFDFPEGETIDIVYAMVIGKGLQGIRQNADNAIKAYYTGSTFSNPLEPDIYVEDEHFVLPFPPLSPELGYSPLNEGMKLVWDTQAEESIDPTLGWVDFEGYKVYRTDYKPQFWELICAFDNLPDSAVFVVNVDGDTVNAKIVDGTVVARGDSGNTYVWDDIVTYGEPGEGQVLGAWAKVDLPDIKNFFVDYGGETPWGEEISAPLNSIPYYYAVSAYDGFKSAAVAGKELPGVASPLSNYKKSPAGAPMAAYPGGLYEQADETPDLDDNPVKVVPNPYLGSAAWEVQYEDRIKFSNLPPVAKISIFSLAGDLVQTITHISGTDYEFWDLVSRNNQSVVSGVYIFIVEAPDMAKVGEKPGEMKKQIGKFAIFR